MPALSPDSFHVYAAPGGLQTARAAVHEVWYAVCNVYPDASKFALRGVGMLVVEPFDLELRFAADFDTGFLACEGLDRANGDRWELFVIAAPHGVVTTGWRRSGTFGSEPPEVWVPGALTLELPSEPPRIVAAAAHPLISENSISMAMANSISLAMAAEAARDVVKRVVEASVDVGVVEAGA